MNLPTTRLRGRGRLNRQPLNYNDPIPSSVGMTMNSPAGKLVIPPGASLGPLYAGWDLLEEALESFKGFNFIKTIIKINALMQACEPIRYTQDPEERFNDEFRELTKKWSYVVQGPESNWPETTQELEKDYLHIHKHMGVINEQSELAKKLITQVLNYCNS